MENTGHKRKKGPELEEPLAKKAKKSKHKTKDGRGEHSEAHRSNHDRKAEFRTVNARMTVNIPPVYSGPGRPRQAVLEMLDSMIMRYIPALRGVVLAHSNLSFASDTAPFLVDSPFARVDISFAALVWSPETGSRIRGTISICSPDHIGLLIHKTFNASIPRHHIPTGKWQFEYGALENDPAFGAAALGVDQDAGEDNGRWFHKTTGESIGGSNGEVEFTIIGLNVSQSMLSILGSLQPDPFSPEHKPQPATSHPTTRKPRTKTSSEEEYSVANALAEGDAEDSEEEDMFDSLKFEMRDFDDEEGAEDLEETIDVGTQPIHDAFAELGRETDKLSREVAREAKLEKKRRKEEKRLRKAQEREAAEPSAQKEMKKKKKDRL